MGCRPRTGDGKGVLVKLQSEELLDLAEKVAVLVSRSTATGHHLGRAGACMAKTGETQRTGTASSVGEVATINLGG